MLDLTSVLPDDRFWNAFLARERLPNSYRDAAETWFAPLVSALLERQSARVHKPLTPAAEVVGLYGCQGSGKSTLAALLEAWLGELGGVRVLTLSLDDFYLPRAERERLAETVHPLFITRGVPGTHEIWALADVLRSVRDAAPDPTVLPKFDKAADDRAPSGVAVTPAHVDLVLLEGWCIGLPAQPAKELAEPANNLERSEDPRAVWRSAVNEALSGPYQAVFDMIDTLLVLKAPSFHSVSAWRWEQEQKLRNRLGDKASGQAGLMGRPALARFLQFYQRLTEWGLETMPARADLCFHLQESRGIERVSGALASQAYAGHPKEI